VLDGYMLGPLVRALKAWPTSTRFWIA